MANVIRINPVTGKPEKVKIRTRLQSQKAMNYSRLNAMGVNESNVEEFREWDQKAKASKEEKRNANKAGGKQKLKRCEKVGCAPLHSPRMKTEFECLADVKPHNRGFTTLENLDRGLPKRESKLK